MFYLFIPFFIVIVWYFIKGKIIQEKYNNIGNEKIKYYLFNKIENTRLRLKTILLVVGIFFVILSSTGPQIGSKLTELKRKGIDIIIALDISKSMNAIDVTPSRISKAKSQLGRLINNLDGDRVGLIVFSGSAHTHCPLTLDYSAAQLFLNSVDTDLISDQGTDVAAAIRLAMDNIPENEETFKLILLVSDGEDHQGSAIEAIKEAADRGVIIHTLGIGTVKGGPIPILNQKGQRIDFKKDRNGNIITTILEESFLNEIARKTGGMYIRIDNKANAIRPLLSEINEMENKELKSHIFSQYEDRYQFFVAIALFFLILEFFIPTKNFSVGNWEG